jgi:serine/threonine-protein kinase
MSSDSWELVAAMFEAAGDLPPADRRAFLERECAGDAALLAQVLDLLDHDDEADREGFLAGARRTTGPFRAADAPTPEEARPARRVQVTVSLDSGLLQTDDLVGLLHERMLTCGWIMFFAYSTFLVKNALDGTFLLDGIDATFCARLVVLFTAVVVIGVLRRRRTPTLRTLRALEWSLLGVNTFYFALDQLALFRYEEWGSIVPESLRGNVLDMSAHSNVLLWFAYMVGYGLVIPNTWWRCARVVLSIALIPVAVILGLGYWEGTLGQLLDAILEMVGWLAIALAIAVYGSHKIAQLTHEVKEARRFGQYELKRPLGSGGMGEVYLAEHALLRRPCAIKLIRPEKAGDSSTLRRFEREVQATAKLRQPNVVEVYDYGRTEDGRFYYVMEYLSGPTLEEMVARYGPLASGRAVALLRQLCKALHEAHKVGLIHRDLKPGNVIVSCQGGQHDLAKLLDFGLVQDLGAATDGRLTEVGLVLGTPAYMSPEQASGSSALDARSDIYSLGCVGFYALTGRPVFEGHSIGQLIAAHLTRSPPDLAGVRPDVPPDLAAVIHRCLAKEPADRFADVAELERTLGRCRCAADWSEEDAAAWWRSRIEPDEAQD